MDGFRLFFNVSRFSPGGPAYFGGRNDHSPGMNCVKIGLPGKLILRKRKGLWEVLFS